MYYWTAFNETTGEIDESNNPHKTVEKARSIAFRHIGDTWGSGLVTVEVWDRPRAYSENFGMTPVLSKRYISTRVPYGELASFLRTLDVSNEEYDDVLGEYEKDRKDWKELE